jgi:hypothetical protein
MWGASGIRYNSPMVFLLLRAAISLIVSGQGPVTPYDAGQNVQISSSMSTVRH